MSAPDKHSKPQPAEQQSHKRDALHIGILLAKWFPKRAERFPTSAYRTPPRDDDELAKLLADYLPDAAARERVLDAVGDGH